ncbi:hypothetical protein CY35_02G102100 [Sphagnum magellanicum]|nr:hypothetical protein CY35_02G102100 [Sphagnum magellanicum]
MRPHFLRMDGLSSSSSSSSSLMECLFIGNHLNIQRQTQFSRCQMGFVVQDQHNKGIREHPQSKQFHQRQQQYLTHHAEHVTNGRFFSVVTSKSPAFHSHSIHLIQSYICFLVSFSQCNSGHF